MKVPVNWLKELVDLKVSTDEVIRLLPLRTIGTKEVTPEFLELDMKGYNRADLLSMRGVAYEIAAITDSSIKFEEENIEKYIKIAENGGSEGEKTQIEIKNPDLCFTYCIAKIEGLKVGASHSEWVKKLNDSGMRSVNNIADVTNLIMLEYGQPLHSFDAEVVKDETIIVRTAKEGEEIKTLDNKIRKLTASDLLITDPEKAIGIAGVMGGLNSEITEKTQTVLLEAAIFDPVNLRKTASRLNLQSEASKRFQHGLTKKRCLQAFDAAIKMYEDLGGKVTGITLVGSLQDKEVSIQLTQRKLNSLIGIEIDSKEVKNYLEKLRFKVEEVPGGWQVTPPYFRLDIAIEEDVIEEVARMYGYEKIPPQELRGKLPEKVDQTLFETIYNLKVALAKAGLSEVQLYSFYSTKIIENCKLETENLIKLLNPMSSETEYMRNNLWSNLIETVAKNLKNGLEEVAIFEVGKTFKPKKGEMPEEKYHLALALSNDSDNAIQELYAIFQTSYSHIGSGKLNLKTDQMDEKEKELFHPVRFAQLMDDDKKIGLIGEIHPRITNKFGIEKRVAILEIEI